MIIINVQKLLVFVSVCVCDPFQPQSKHLPETSIFKFHQHSYKTIFYYILIYNIDCKEITIKQCVHNYINWLLFHDDCAVK